MKMARSPNYPSADLSAALAMIRKIYERDHRNKVSQEAVASHLGHESLSGPALGKIGALRAYGLIQGAGDELRVTDDAVTALEAPEGSRDRAEAIRRMAFKPPLFKEIAEAFPSPPSEDNLRYWLVKRAFLSDAASKAAKVYLNTFRLVPPPAAGYDSPSPMQESEHMQPSEAPSSIPARQSHFFGGEWPPQKAGMRQEIITLDDGDVTITFPENLSSDSFGDLEDHLKIFIRKMKRRINAKETASDVLGLLE